MLNSKHTPLLIIGIIILAVLGVLLLFSIRFSSEPELPDYDPEQAQAEAIQNAPRLKELIEGKQEITVLTTNDLFTVEYNPHTSSFGVRVLDTTEEDARGQVERYFTQLGIKDPSKLKIYYRKNQ